MASRITGLWGGACLAVALKTKNKDLRSAAISAGISGLFGITEPALYGVTLQHKKVMMSVCASGFIGGLFIGLMKIKAFAAVGPGIASMPMYIDPDNGMNFVWAVVAFVISVVLSFVFTLFAYSDPKEETAGGADADAAAPAAVAETAASAASESISLWPSLCASVTGGTVTVSTSPKRPLKPSFT